MKNRALQTPDSVSAWLGAFLIGGAWELRLKGQQFTISAIAGAELTDLESRLLTLTSHESTDCHSASLHISFFICEVG